MAGDWIKMRTNIDTDWRVIQISAELNLPELHVVGCLWKLWTWADQHTVDGNAIRVTDVTLDRFTSVTGFANAMRSVGWLCGENGSLCFPNFSEHNGSTAKKRAETKERVAKHRNAKGVTDVTLNVLPEKRREEKRREEDIKKKPAPLLKPDGIEDRAWGDWLAVRKKHRKGPPTESVMAKIEREAAKAGITLGLAIQASAEYEWIGFESAWYNERIGKSVTKEIAF